MKVWDPKKRKEGKAEIKEGTCAEAKAYLILLEEVLQSVLKYATASSEFLQCSAEADLTWEQISFSPFYRWETGSTKQQWLSKPECDRSVQEATSVPGAPGTCIDTMDPTEWKPSQRFTLLLRCRLAEKLHSGELCLS